MAKQNKSIEQTIEETRKIWQELGRWWAERSIDGDAFHKEFIFPYIEELASVKKGDLILDAGCGSGALARIFAKQGARVVAVDFSRSLLEVAEANSKGFAIEYKEVDLTNKKQLKELHAAKFDKIVCSMVLHNMPTIEPFFDSLNDLLKPDGSFIFTVPHPCFNTKAVIHNFAKNNLPAGTFITTSDYSTTQMFTLKSKPDQPIEQLSFDRPLSSIFSLLFKNGFVMNGFFEPVAQDTKREGFWHNFAHVPPAVISRWIKLKSYLECKSP